MPRKRQLKQQLHALLDQIEIQRNGVLAAQPDALHQLRIGLRGWRALLPLVFRRRETDLALLQAWRSLAALTGPARDAEVQLTQLPDDHPARPQIIQQRDTGYAVVRTALSSVDWPVLLAASHAWLDLSLAERQRAVLRRRIRRRSQRLVQRLADDLAHPRDAEHWHALRLDVKRLRYLIEHAGRWLHKRQRKLHAALKRAQSDLGDLHDYDVQFQAGWRDDVAHRAPLEQAAAASARQLTRQLAALPD